MRRVPYWRSRSLPGPHRKPYCQRLIQSNTERDKAHRSQTEQGEGNHHKKSHLGTLNIQPDTAAERTGAVAVNVRHELAHLGASGRGAGLAMHR